MQLTAHWEGGYRMRVRVRGFDVVVDEPPEDGGTDTGPAPTEYLVASLAACYGMAIYHGARKRQVELPDLTVDVSADYEGLRLSRFLVTVRSEHPREEMELLMEQAARWCYVSNTLQSQPQIEYVLADASITQPSASVEGDANHTHPVVS